MFSFAELCVLLDFDHTAALSTFPMPDEIALFVGDGGRPIVRASETVETSGALRFRDKPEYLYEPPSARIKSTLWRCELEIERFSDKAIYTPLADWASSYLGDTLAHVPKSKGRWGFRRFRGDGVVVDLGFWPPHVADAGGQIQVQVTRDEPLVTTVGRILRAREESLLAPDGKETRLASGWDMRVTSSLDDASVKIRWTAPSRAQDYDANDSERCSAWLDAFLIHHFEHGRVVNQDDTGWTTGWTVPRSAGAAEEAVTLHRLRSDGRKTGGEIRFPRRWIEAARAA